MNLAKHAKGTVTVRMELKLKIVTSDKEFRNKYSLPLHLPSPSSVGQSLTGNRKSGTIGPNAKVNSSQLSGNVVLLPVVSHPATISKLCDYMSASGIFFDIRDGVGSYFDP